MAYTSRALFNLRILCILFIVCNLYGVVSSVANETEPWCILNESPEAVGSMECKFTEEVQYIQVDHYPFESQAPPVIAVSCDQTSCEPNANFTDMLKVRGSPSKQLLTLTLHGVPKAHAGKYRCQAQSTANSQTVEGQCSLRFPNTGDNTETPGAINDDGHVDTPTEEFNPLILLVLLVVPIVAIAIGIVICKLNSCGPWKQNDERTKSPKDVEKPEEKSLLDKEKPEKTLEEDENEQEGKQEVLKQEEEEGKTTDENAENLLPKDDKEEKNSDDDDDDDDDDKKSEEGNESSSEHKDGDVSEAAPEDINSDALGEKAPTIATDEDVVKYVK